MAQFRVAQHDTAYLCFLPTGLLGLATGIANTVPVGTGAAGGIGLLVLVPLAILALVAVPKGLYLSFILQKDRVLLVLSVMTLAWIAVFFVETGPRLLRNLAHLGYGVVVLVLVSTWFLKRRRQPVP